MATDTDIDAAIETEISDRAAAGFPQRIRCPDGREVEMTPLADLLAAQNRIRRRSRPRARLIYPIAE